jgi:hypothetical protein
VNGLMTAADKAKLDGLANVAQTGYCFTQWSYEGGGLYAAAVAACAAKGTGWRLPSIGELVQYWYNGAYDKSKGAAWTSSTSPSGGKWTMWGDMSTNLPTVMGDLPTTNIKYQMVCVK